ncbi:MAG: 3-hydroxyacyl-ACP dehydratase FabZ [Ruminococcaceae bacterium]|nr:3-hydroxyacyl-ACP dehydratase FabZ [Oscillospiraceae bacterium]
MNLIEINKRIKQRPPFQMIEKVLELEPDQRAVGIKNVSVNEPYFVGHFPDFPIMPGVLVTEACAQLCSLVIDPEKSNDPNVIFVLLKIKDFKFVKPVVPGDTLVIEVNKTLDSSGLYEFSAVVKVEDTIKAKGTLMFTAVDKGNIYGE